MKPSEKRALRAQKAAEKTETEKLQEKEWTAENVAEDEVALDAESELRNDTGAEAEEQYVWGSHKSETESKKKPYKRKEGFFQSHIRLITFIVTTVVLILFLSPFAVDMIVKYRNDKIVNSIQDIDMDSVFSIYDNSDVIEWKSFSNFNYTDLGYDTENGEYRVREYPISNSRLVLKVGGHSMSNRPEYVQLIDYRTGQFINVFNEDPRDFIRTLNLDEKETK